MLVARPLPAVRSHVACRGPNPGAVTDKLRLVPKDIGLRGLATRDRIHILTVDPPSRGREPAWPAFVCDKCRDTMGHNFLDFRFARHPQCPECHVRRTMKAIDGLPGTRYVETWQHLRACRLTEEKPDTLDMPAKGLTPACQRCWRFNMSPT